MRFTIRRENLLKGLNMVSKAVPAKADLPALQNIKMICNEKGLELIGSDKNMTIRSIVPYMIEDTEIIRNAKPGATLIKAKQIVDIVRHADSEYIDFELIDRSILKITDGESVFKPNTSKPEDYPQIDLETAENSFDIKSSDLILLAETTAFAASNKDTRPTLMAVNLSANQGTLSAVATDTARMARKRIQIDSNSVFSINIPAKKLLDIVHSFEDAEVVTFSCNSQKASFSFGNTLILTSLTNGQYPPTDRVMPKSFNYSLEVNSREFLAAMEKVSLFGGIVKMIMSEDEVELISRSTEAGSANVKLQTFQFAGERLEVSFYSTYIVDAIKALGSEDVTFAMVGEMKPFIVKNVKDDTVDMLVTSLIH